MKLKFLKEITILCTRFDIVWDKKHDGGQISFKDCKITVGTMGYSKNPEDTLEVLSHEIMEVVFIQLGARYENPRSGELLFNFNHQTFETAIQIHTQAITKFIYQK